MLESVAQKSGRSSKWKSLLYPVNSGEKMCVHVLMIYGCASMNRNGASSGISSCALESDWCGVFSRKNFIISRISSIDARFSRSLLLVGFGGSDFVSTLRRVTMSPRNGATSC